MNTLSLQHKVWIGTAAAIAVVSVVYGIVLFNAPDALSRGAKECAPTVADCSHGFCNHVCPANC